MGLTGGLQRVPGLVFVHRYPITLKTQGQRDQNEDAHSTLSTRSPVLTPAHCWPRLWLVFGKGAGVEWGGKGWTGI